MKTNISLGQLKKKGWVSLISLVSVGWQFLPSAYSQTMNQAVISDSGSACNHLSQDMDTLLSTSQVQAELSSLPGWQFTGKAIYKTFMFDDFVGAIAFVNQLVEPAEASGHHPDLKISYNRVVVTLTTHDAGGLTAKDVAMAQSIAHIYTHSGLD